MTTRSSSLLAIAIVLGAFGPSAVAGKGESVETAIQELVNRHLNGAKDPKEFEIDEQAANEFLRTDPARPLPDGVESPWVRFEDHLAIVGATVDLDKFRGSLPDSALLFLLTGRVPVEITARIDGEQGVGKLNLERFLLGGIELPASLVAGLAQTETASKLLPPGFKLGESFRLPYEIESIRCRVGALSLRQGPAPTPSAK